MAGYLASEDSTSSCVRQMWEKRRWGGEEEDVVVEEEEEGEEGCSQRSSDLPMTASVDPEIHKNL